MSKIPSISVRGKNKRNLFWKTTTNDSSTSRVFLTTSRSKLVTCSAIHFTQNLAEQPAVLMGSGSFRETHQWQLFMKDGKWNSLFVDASQSGFNKDPFFISWALRYPCVRSTVVAARHPRWLDLGYISHSLSQRLGLQLEQNHLQ